MNIGLDNVPVIVHANLSKKIGIMSSVLWAVLIGQLAG